MNYESLIKHYGTVTKAAATLGYSVATLYLWRKRGIPEKTQAAIQAKTKGKLKMMRPDEQAERYQSLNYAFETLVNMNVPLNVMETLAHESGYPSNYLNSLIGEKMIRDHEGRN